MAYYATVSELKLSPDVAALNPQLLAEPDVSPDVSALNPEWASLMAKPAKRTKYGNVRCEFNNIKFASKAEMIRYGDLRLLELTGQISNLEVQPAFLLTGGIKYKGDFRYIEGGRVIVEDVKGVQTRVFINKWKQVKELFPFIEFRIVQR